MRKHYIDNIRWVTIVLVVIYHVIYLFNASMPEIVIGPVTSFHGQDAFQNVVYPWFMVILFLISGMCSKYYLENHTTVEYLKSRTVKLLVPSTLGILAFQWTQGYYSMLICDSFSTISDVVPIPVLFLIMCLSGTGVLWTIQMMWLYSVVLVIVKKFEKGRLCALGKKANMPVLLVLGIFVWFFAQILNTPIIAVYRFGIYGFVFFLGYFVFAWEEVTDCLTNNCFLISVAAGILGVAETVLYYGKNIAVAPIVNAPLSIAYCWMAVLAVLGLFKKYYNKTDRVAAFMKKKCFGLYVFHYLALSATGYYLTTYTKLPGVCIYIVCTVAAFVGGILIYEIILRIPVYRWLVLGISRKKETK